MVLAEDKKIAEALSLIEDMNKILIAFPEGKETLRRLQNGEISMEQGVAELINLIRSKELLPEIERVAQEVSSLVPGYELNPDILEKASRPVSMKTSTGLSQLNPVYEASIAERAFLDGDVPELRSGPLPEGGTPAVPVKTDSLDPVTIGLLLDIASKKVQRQLERQRDEFVLIQERLIHVATEEARIQKLDEKTAIEIAKKNLPSVPTGIPGYQAGEVPLLMELEPVQLIDLDLPLGRRQLLAYRALSTTQGRRSLVIPIWNELRNALEAGGLKIENEPSKPGRESLRASWIMTVWGPEDISDNFSFAKLAASSMAMEFLFEREKFADKILVLEVLPYNGIAERQFGWVAVLGTRD